jgi:ABC-type multidrug transport system permease subunit
MDQLTHVILVLLPLVALLFWLWMFWDMSNNEHLPQCFLSFTQGNNPTFDWWVVFIFLNVFAAIFYYVSVYRNRP